MTSQANTESIDPVFTLERTEAADAKLVAWCGDLGTAFAYWPTDDRDAFETAVREWVRRDVAVFGFADDDASDETRVERYMAAIRIDDVETDEPEPPALTVDVTSVEERTTDGTEELDASVTVTIDGCEFSGAVTLRRSARGHWTTWGDCIGIWASSPIEAAIDAAEELGHERRDVIAEIVGSVAEAPLTVDTVD